ncbi:hypothetical protein [Mesorhizobium sp. M0998]|uniref:hypothetical protein n=1 Tax=Mesorhizobium sp. M0998 TaxID=2957044 RepID=UPI00333D3E3F
MTVDAFRCWRPAAVLAHFQARLGRKLCARRPVISKRSGLFLFAILSLAVKSVAEQWSLPGGAWRNYQALIRNGRNDVDSSGEPLSQQDVRDWPAGKPRTSRRCFAIEPLSL